MELGLMKGDGSCPFVLAPPPPRPALADPPPTPTARPLTETLGQLFQQRAAKAAVPPLRIGQIAWCRARTGLPNQRCTSAVHADKLCRRHWQEARNGHPVHDFATGLRLWTS